MKQLLAFSLFIGSFSLYGQADYADIDLDYGQYPVGFSYHLEIDSSRVYRRMMDYTETLQFREIPIGMWYPAGAATDTAMRVADYLDVLKQEEEWETLPAAFVLDWFYYPRNEITEKNGRCSTMAFREAMPAPGNYPVVIYAPSYQASSAENFMLCEYLASHGYLVLAAPSRGAYARQLRGGTAEDAGAQSADLGHVFGYAAGLDRADLDRVYTVGFSFGGLSNVPFAMRNRFVDGVVSLDGTIKYNLPAAAALPGFDPSKLRVPFVHFRQKDIPVEVVRADGIDSTMAERFPFMDSLTVTAYEFVSPHLTHGQFASFGLLFEPRDERQDHSVREVATSYADLCEAVLVTLRTMETSASSGQWEGQTFEESMGGLDFQLAGKVEAPAAGTLGTNDFFDALRGAGYARIDSVYDAFLIRDETFSIGQGPLNTVGLQLGLSSQLGAHEAGIAVLVFAVARYPESANLHDSLATIYQYQGMKELAIHHFRRSLKLYPGNGNAQKQLEVLGAD